MLRITDEYPDYSGFIPVLEAGGITEELLNKIVNKHLQNAAHTRELHNRYKTREDAVPIFNREPRFKHDTPEIEEINNQVNNDFFSEIVDIATGYFAGNAATYKYADTDVDGENIEAEDAKKALSDFVTRNNMFNCNMKMTKYATMCGYAGRLFYVDKEGQARVMITPPYETIIIAEDEITEPYAGVRYYPYYDIDDVKHYKAEFYDDTYIYKYEGELGGLVFKEKQAHGFDYCPLQGIPRNEELLGDAEKVLAAIDDYDKVVSDNSNDIEGNTNAHMIFQNIIISDDEMAKARKSGAFRFNGLDSSKVYYLTKEVNDAFNQHHLERTEDNIYRFSKTPNLNSDKFGESSGVALKFKITGLESKCGTFEAKCLNADIYMYKVIGSYFTKNRIAFDPLQCYAVYKRNFPMDLVNEAQTAQGLKNAGLPKRFIFEQLSFVDDVDYIMDEIEKEKEDIPSLFSTLPEDNETEKEETQETELQNIE